MGCVQICDLRAVGPQAHAIRERARDGQTTLPAACLRLLETPRPAVPGNPPPPTVRENPRECFDGAAVFRYIVLVGDSSRYLQVEPAGGLQL